MNRIETYNTSQTKRLSEIRTKFIQSLNEVTSEMTCTYYDFLMVAKKLSFRFEQASHLMTLKNYFAKNANVLDKKKLADLLLLNVSAMSEASSDKTIIKFALSQYQSTFQPIQQMTNQDDQNYESQRRVRNRPKIISEQASTEKDYTENYKSVDSQQKIEVIVSMKMHQMVKKVQTNTFQILKQNITFDVFKRTVNKIFNSNAEKLKISEDDIKTIFFLLDIRKKNELFIEDLNVLKDPTQFFIDLRQFYRFRINPELLKNTELKRGKHGNNTVQVFQLKNPSILQLRQIQSTLTEDAEMMKRPPPLSTKPRFGPLRHSYARRKSSPVPQYRSMIKRNSSAQILQQKDKIQRILKASKQKKLQRDSNQTIASRLRRLFIHKVILPRQRMLQQQKQHGKKVTNSNYLQVKSNKI